MRLRLWISCSVLRILRCLLGRRGVWRDRCSLGWRFFSLFFFFFWFWGVVLIMLFFSLFSLCIRTSSSFRVSVRACVCIDRPCFVDGVHGKWCRRRRIYCAPCIFFLGSMNIFDFRSLTHTLSASPASPAFPPLVLSLSYVPPVSLDERHLIASYSYSSSSSHACTFASRH